MKSEAKNNGGGGATATTVNSRAINRAVGDSQTSAGYTGGPRSPHHSTEGGNYHYQACPEGWGGNVHR